MYSISILHFTYLGVHTHPLPPGLAALLNELTYCIVVSSTVALVGSLISSSGHNQSQQAYTKFNNEGTKNLKRMHGFFAHYSGTAGTRLTLKCTRGVPCVFSGGFRGVRPHPPWRPSEKFMVYQFRK